MTAPGTRTLAVPRIDPEREAERISQALRNMLQGFRRKGAVVAVSGGVDSSVVAALCVRALGADRVIALFLPEAESSGDSLRLGRELAGQLGIRSVVQDISPVLKALGAYDRREECVRAVLPDYQAGDRWKIVLPGVLADERYAVFSVVAETAQGTRKERLTADAYLGILAATNCKQRVRKLLEYYHADLLNYAVMGTPNKLEYDLGFFVKNGDGAADIKPIAHLYKSQVYDLAAYLGVPEEICRRTPTTDTYSLEQTQEEFYFSLPLRTMDLCLYALLEHVPPAELATAAGITPEQAERVYRSIESRRAAARYLQSPPLLVTTH